MAGLAGPVPAFDPAFPSLKALVIERTGHFYYKDKDELLWERARKRFRATGRPDSATYIELLCDPVRGPPEWRQLEAEITIGETFFFRYVEQFTALRDVILPELIARKASQKRLRIWSAGCSNGAEAYSLAILLTELLGEDLPHWGVRIVGTDINDALLNSARTARFGQWALRSLTPDQKEDYFTAAAERAQWLLRPEFRSLVRFERHNLLSLLDGSSPLQYSDFDLILCRNVLIYFHHQTATKVVEGLRDTLSEGGWMLLGHAESNQGFASLMLAVNLPGSTAYRRLPPEEQAWPQPSPAPAPAPATAPTPWVPAPDTAHPSPVEVAPEKFAGKAVAPPVLSPQPLPVTRESQLDEIRSLADAGELARAADLCRQALAGRPVDAELHFYKGLIAHHMKRGADAEKAFRDCIYLDKNFVMARYHLGLHLISVGEQRSGQRSIANAARIAVSLPEASLLTQSDGMTARDFGIMVRTRHGATLRSRRKA